MEAGHRSIVIAAAGSEIAGELAPTPRFNGEITDAVREQAHEAQREAIEQAIRQCEPDLIHFHGLDFANYIPEGQTPKLATLHLPVSWYPAQIFDLTGLTLNCVSESQAGTAPAGHPMPVVKNGIDVEAFAKTNHERGPLLWLGRICPEKGVHLALRVAHRLALPLIVAGPVHPFEAHEVYFENEVKPLLDGARQWIGPVDFERKRMLLGEARCLLVPSLAPETGSLAAMEAIASGTAVIAFPSGALPEIVEDGVTGFIAGNEEEMANSVARLVQIAPETCRATARQRFDFRRMTADYIALYGQVLSESLSCAGR